MLSLLLGRSGAQEGEEFVEEVRELGVDIETLVGSGRKPEDVILTAAHNGDYDLLVMGVLFRSSEQRICFGPRVREVLRGARCSVALVVPPHQSLPDS
jgi:nucleotide-binding universal stress UspA family protein